MTDVAVPGIADAVLEAGVTYVLALPRNAGTALVVLLLTSFAVLVGATIRATASAVVVVALS